MSDDLTTTEALAAVRARLDQAYAMKAEAEQSIKDLTLALIGIGKEAAETRNANRLQPGHCFECGSASHLFEACPERAEQIRTGRRDD